MLYAHPIAVYPGSVRLTPEGAYTTKNSCSFESQTSHSRGPPRNHPEGILQGEMVVLIATYVYGRQNVPSFVCPFREFIMIDFIVSKCMRRVGVGSLTARQFLTFLYFYDLILKGFIFEIPFNQIAPDLAKKGNYGVHRIILMYVSVSS